MAPVCGDVVQWTDATISRDGKLAVLDHGVKERQERREARGKIGSFAQWGPGGFGRASSAT